jgi:hypothetical protein
MADFTAIFKDIEKQIVTLASATTSNYKEEAIADGKLLLAAIKDDLERWLTLLKNGTIKTWEFEWLVNSDKSLVKMNALKQAGLAAVRIQQFSMSVLNMIVDTSLKAVMKT